MARIGPRGGPMRSAHRRSAAVGGAVALVGVVGVGAAVGAPTAPRQAGGAGSPPARQSAPSPGSSPVTSVAVVPAPAAAPVVARGRSRLALTVTPGRTLAVVGVLTRAATGAAVGG